MRENFVAIVIAILAVIGLIVVIVNTLEYAGVC